MNTVILQGNLASGIECKQVVEHTVGRLLLAVNRPGKDKGADFVRVVVWNKTAENCAKFLDKGSKVAVAGRIRGEFGEKEGRKQLAFEVVAERVSFLDSRSSARKAA